MNELVSEDKPTVKCKADHQPALPLPPITFFLLLSSPSSKAIFADIQLVNERMSKDFRLLQSQDQFARENALDDLQHQKALLLIKLEKLKQQE
eukprot:m.66330 g.66330  ORF g.66330 m.66330 type:complete len:93 (+) comp19712_c0_seq1:524-802(+)